MFKTFYQPDKREIHSATQFFNARNIKAVKIHQQFTEIYSESVMRKHKIPKEQKLKMTMSAR